jgi:hypothetical protein
MKEVPYRGPKYVRRQHSQFTRLCSKISCQACADPNNTWGIQHVLSPEIIKVTFTQELATNSQRGNIGTALLFP